jgi:hypothetical protein
MIRLSLLKRFNYFTINSIYPESQELDQDAGHKRSDRAFRHRRFSTSGCDDSIGERREDFPGMLKKRTFEVVRIRSRKPTDLDFHSTPDAIISYTGTRTFGPDEVRTAGLHIVQQTGPRR